MRKIISLIFLLITSICAQAQMDANWLFGDSLGIKFNSGSINPIESSIKTVEAAASISDSLGNLLFYTDGGNVYNKLNQLMDNGDSLNNGQISNGGNTITNGVIIIPVPLNQNTQFYIIYLNSFNTVTTRGLYYSLVDISANGGLGKVIAKNDTIIILPIDSTNYCEKIAITRHANGRDWWVLIHQVNSEQFIKFLLSPFGISGPYYQCIGRSPAHFGEMIFNNQGNQLVNVGPSGLIDLFDFNRCTGELSNYKNLGSTIYPDNVDTNYFYGVAFSPDDSKIYVSNAGKGIIQFSNFTGGDTINNYIKKWIVFHLSVLEINYGQLELAPNGKIYIARYIIDTTVYGFDSINEFLAEISYPNLTFPLCQYNLFGQWLFNRSINIDYDWSLPYFPNYNLSALDDSPCDTLRLGIKGIENKKTEVSIYPNPASDKVMIRSFDIDIESITVFNMVGQQKIKHNYKNDKKVELSLNNLSSGIYIVEIETAHGVVREKFVKE